MSQFQVFRRRAWRKDGDRWVPLATPGRHHCYVSSEEEARRICQQANADRPAYGTAGYYRFTYTEYRRV